VAWFRERLTGVDPAKAVKTVQGRSGANNRNHSRAATIGYPQREERVEKERIKKKEEKAQVLL
jgi:hypothetical protein